MTKTQNSYRDMWYRVKDYLDLDPNLVTSLLDVNTMYTAWLAKLDLWDPLAAQQATTGGDVAQHKKDAIAEAADLCSKWGRRCSVAAHQQGLYSVEATLNHRAYEITQLPADAAYHLMQAMRDALDLNMLNFADQGLTAAVVAAIGAKLDAINAVLNAPKVAIDNHEAVTIQLANLQAELIGDLEPIMQLLEAEYEDSKPDFVQGLMLAHELGTPAGKRYSGLEGVVTRNGVVAAGYKVVCKGMEGKEAVTDILGHYAIRSMRPGYYEFELQNSGGARLDSATLRVKQGVTLVKDWEQNVTG